MVEVSPPLRQHEVLKPVRYLAGAARGVDDIVADGEPAPQLEIGRVGGERLEVARVAEQLLLARVLRAAARGAAVRDGVARGGGEGR